MNNNKAGAARKRIVASRGGSRPASTASKTAPRMERLTAQSAVNTERHAIVEGDDDGHDAQEQHEVVEEDIVDETHADGQLLASGVGFESSKATKTSRAQKSSGLPHAQKSGTAAKAPVHLVTEFLAMMMANDFRNAQALCAQILAIEPDNATAQEFARVLSEKISLDEEAESSDDESSEDDDEDDEGEDDEDDDEGEDEGEDGDDDDEGIHSRRAEVAGQRGHHDTDECDDDEDLHVTSSSGLLARTDRMNPSDLKAFVPKKMGK